MPRRARLVGWLDDDTTVTSSEMFPPLCGGSSSCGGLPTTPGSTLQYSTSGSAKTLARNAFAVYAVEVLTSRHAMIRPGDCSGRCHWMVVSCNDDKVDSAIATTAFFRPDIPFVEPTKDRNLSQRGFSALLAKQPQDV